VQHDGDYILMFNEHGPPNDPRKYGKVNLAFYCVSPSGVIKWKRKYWAYRDYTSSMYGTDFQIADNDHIILTGTATNLEDSTDKEWDVLIGHLDEEGCLVDGCTDYKDGFVGIQDVDVQKEKIWIYPNPASDYFDVLLSSPLVKEAVMEVIDINGRVVLIRDLKKGESEFKIEDLNLVDGLYSIRIKINSEMIEQAKLMILN
jgi:hypothetical protein